MINKKMWKALAICTLFLGTMAVPKLRAQAAATDTVLKPADLSKLLPEKVFYRGQSAPTQLRNSGGIKFADGFYVLATLVDTSGYSTGVSTRYQAYFVTEIPITVGGEKLSPGVYGIGFIADNKLVVSDVGAHDLITVATGNDDGLKRPTPLQVIADPAGGFRLYSGHRYVLLSR